MSYQTLLVSTQGGIGEIHLNRPKLGNALNSLALDELDRAAAAFSDNGDVLVVVLTAEGDDFCRGWEGETAAAPGERSLPFRSLEMMAQPVIACMQGEAAGAGLELALACDMRVAGEGASFAMPQVAAGNVPSFGGTARLPRIVGRSAAATMILLGEQFDAAQALRCGLVNAVVPDARLRDKAAELAQAIAAQGPLGVRYAKEVMREGLDMPLTQALRYETDLTIILQTTADRAEGVRAFMEKRPPKFTGR